MSKKKTLHQAAEFIEREAECLRESHRDPGTGLIQEKEIKDEYQRAIHLAYKLRQYARKA